MVMITSLFPVQHIESAVMFLVNTTISLLFFFTPSSLPTRYLSSSLPPHAQGNGSMDGHAKKFSLLSLPESLKSWVGFEDRRDLSKAAKPKGEMRWCSNRSLFTRLLFCVLLIHDFLSYSAVFLFQFSE